jgi:type III restriction-modification system methyltransferase
MEKAMTEELNKVPHETPNFATEAASQLAELFPEIVRDGKINLDTLKTILDVDVEDGRERFGLTWPGKREAIRAAQTPTTATLMPDKQNSINWDTTQNVFIEGDNLEVLKILQKHYYGKIKMIYIDPPYNTGNDFVYSDNYADPIGNYLEMTGQTDDGGKLSSNSESAGRFHSNWLNMMYPRLKLARELLTHDGVIFISIDDHEYDNLMKICIEIFGESNRVATFVWKSKSGGANDSGEVAVDHEYIICFARSKTASILNLDPEAIATTSYSHEDENGKYALERLDKQNLQYSSSMDYDLIGPDGQTYTLSHRDPAHPNATWRWSKERVQRDMDQLVFKDGKVYTKNYEKSHGRPRSLLIDDRFGRTRTGSTELRKLLGGSHFDNPKPTRLLNHLVTIGTGENSIILDFFAGSGSTAQAVMTANANYGGNRRYIIIQIPEPTGIKSAAHQAGYSTISEITRERIRRASTNISQEEATKLDGRNSHLDVGFRAYKLVDTNFTKWKADSGLSEGELVDLFSGMTESANDDAHPGALLSEVLLKLGFSLTEKVETVEIEDLKVFSVSDGLVMAYLDEHTTPTLAQLRALVAKEPERLVILEDTFKGNDELKTNLVQECRIHNVDLWTA